MKVDSHQHFWNPARGDYGWMPKGHPVLDRVYGPAELAPQLSAAGIGRTVLVQAAPSIAETEYMLGLADATDFVAGVVGWVDFDTRDDLTSLRRLAGHPKFKGVRPMIQDLADDHWMLGDAVQWGFRALCDLDLTFDALGFPRHLAIFAELLARYPEMRVVIDHGMKPQIRGGKAGFQTWADGMSRLAERAGTCVKFSALVTEAEPGWTVEDLQPWAAHLFAAFGADRVMWGSDWPVCRLQCSYADWFAAAQTLTEGLSTQDQAKIFGGTATEFYRL